MKKFLLKYKGKYLIKLKDFNKGTWTSHKEYATIFNDEEFFLKNYPKLKLEEVK